MSHGSMKYAKALVAIITVGLISACADKMAPTTQMAKFKAPPHYDIVVGVQTFRIYNNEGISERIGDHVLNVPAGAICDPETSSYGSTEWDKPCTPMTGSIEITATMMRDNDNHPYLDFQPALRFDPTKQVMLFLRNGRAPEPTRLALNYCNNLGDCVDESVEDPSLSWFRIGATSYLGRRIKHFSGYYVAVGDPCEGTLTQEENGSWMCVEEEVASRRSGYMVASGKDGKDIIVEDKDGKKKEENDQ